LKHPLSQIPNFWSLQVIFWIGLCLITYLTLTLWYGQTTIPHVFHTLLQGAVGLALSYPLHLLYSRIWNLDQRTRIFLSLTAVAIIAAIWTTIRMVLFIRLTREYDLWSDFGGWYFGGIFVFLCWSGFYHGIRYFYLVQSEHAQTKIAEASVVEEHLKRLGAESDAKEAQLKMLRYQLNPHFLFNTLNAINSLIQSQQTERAQKIIVHLSKFLRFSLDNNPEMRVPLYREIDALNLYLEIEKTRFGDRLILDFNIDDKTKFALIPSLLLQPLIENSMKYAVAKNEEGGTIKIHSKLQNQSLVLEIGDTGAGEKLQSSTIRYSGTRGIGLRNTTDRLKAFYDEDYKFDLSINRFGGLKTTIEIPIELSPDAPIQYPSGTGL
jgi:hypothetical protein